jgi:hypothetical protein
MSTPDQRYEWACGILRQTKENTVANAPEGDPGDICPAVLFERDGVFVAATTAPVVDRDMGLMAAQIGIPGFAADSVVWAADAHVTNTQINPATGEKWGPNEMQNACDNEGACAVGILRDCILAVHVDRVLGTRGFRSLTYEVDKAARKVKWTENPDDPLTTDFAKAGKADGFISDQILAAFTAPIARHEMIARGAMPIGLPALQQERIDLVTGRILNDLGLFTLLFKDKAGLLEEEVAGGIVVPV